MTGHPRVPCIDSRGLWYLRHDFYGRTYCHRCGEFTKTSAEKQRLYRQQSRERLRARGERRAQPVKPWPVQGTTRYQCPGVLAFAVLYGGRA